VAWVNSILVIAGITAGSNELHDAMMAEANHAPTRFELVMPRRAHGPRGAMDAAFGLQRALARAADMGLVVRGRFGDDDPVIAAVENFDPWRVDKIILCTLPAGVSRWCAMDVPARVRRLTGAPVLHVHAHADAPRRTVPPIAVAA
jgi:hypothetical protein